MSKGARRGEAVFASEKRVLGRSCVQWANEKDVGPVTPSNVLANRAFRAGNFAKLASE